MKREKITNDRLTGWTGREKEGVYYSIARVRGRSYYRVWFRDDASGGLVFIRDRIADRNRARRLARAWLRRDHKEMVWKLEGDEVNA